MKVALFIVVVFLGGAFFYASGSKVDDCGKSRRIVAQECVRLTENGCEELRAIVKYVDRCTVENNDAEHYARPWARPHEALAVFHEP